MPSLLITIEIKRARIRSLFDPSLKLSNGSIGNNPLAVNVNRVQIDSRRRCPSLKKKFDRSIGCERNCGRIRPVRETSTVPKSPVVPLGPTVRSELMWSMVMSLLWLAAG